MQTIISKIILFFKTVFAFLGVPGPVIITDTNDD